MKEGCFNCKHKDKPYKEVPCCGCRKNAWGFYTKWEKEEKE